MQKGKVLIQDVKQEITPFKTPNGSEIRKITLSVDKAHPQKTVKMSFYSHKKGTDEETVAYKGFKTGKIVKGAEIETAWNEQEDSFVNKEGKNINYVKRFVSFFDGLSNEVSIEENTESEISAEDIPF